MQRFRTDGFTQLPPMRALGELWMRDAAAPGPRRMGATEAATAAGYVLAAELRACGVDFSFTPVLDLDYGASSVIGDRAFHRDPRVVGAAGQEPDARPAAGRHGATAASTSRGTASCGPIRTSTMPVDRRSLKAILADDARPIEWLGSTLDSRDAGACDLSAGSTRGRRAFRRTGCSDILRDQTGLRGRDLQRRPEHGRRRAASTAASSATPRPALAALDAGCDLVLLCNESVGEGAVLDGCWRASPRAERSGRWQPREASEARRRALLPAVPAPDWPTLMASRRYIRARELLSF